MEVMAVLPNGDRKPLKVLVDTGAEANLINIGVIPGHLTFPARKAIRLVSANGQPIRGGQDSSNMHRVLTGCGWAEIGRNA